MLAPLLRGGRVKAWDDKKILAGSDWRKEIEKGLASSRVALVLVSADLLASDFVMNQELPALFEAAEQGELRLLWVLVRESLWKHTQLEQIQSPLSTDKALEAMSPSDRGQAFVKLCDAILQAYEVFDDKTAAKVNPR
jgi:hypothetical protein